MREKCGCSTLHGSREDAILDQKRTEKFYIFNFFDAEIATFVVLIKTKKRII